MKITDLTCFTGPKQFLAKVETEAGVVGWGESSPMHVGATLALVLETIKPAIVGQDLFDAETIEEAVIPRNYKMAGQLLAMAYSGVEIALWDARARSLGMPIHRLIGGRYRGEVDYYGSSMSRHLTPEEEAAKLADGVARHGFRAVKIKVGPRYGSGRPVDLAADVAKVRIVRAAIGPAVKLMVDANSSYSFAEAVQFWERAKEHDLCHFEEPCPYHDVSVYERLARVLPVPIHVGEQDWNLVTFREFIARGACHLYACDVVKCGGIDSARRAATLCRAFGVTYAPHNTSRGIGLAASLQLAAALPECHYFFEYNLESEARTERFLRQPFVVHDGRGAIPTGPGLGIEIEEEKVRQTLTVAR